MRPNSNSTNEIRGILKNLGFEFEREHRDREIGEFRSIRKEAPDQASLARDRLFPKILQKHFSNQEIILNFKKLQSIARRRLGLTGDVEFVQKGGGKGRILATSVANSSLEMKHTVTYSDAESIDPADVYHELCRARLYELGFRTVENATLMALKDCAGDDPKFIFDANSSVVIVSEVYVSWMLYTYFPEESESRRQEIVLRFKSSDALTSLHTQMGFWGTAGIAYYRLASEWTGKTFPSKQVEAPISRLVMENLSMKS